MTHDEVRARSFEKISAALSMMFPGIPSRTNGDSLYFDDEIIRVEMSSSDSYDGYFSVLNEHSNSGNVWGVKPVVAILIREICEARKRKIMDLLK